MLISNVINVKWWPTSREIYESKGYKFTKYKDIFEVNVNDLSEHSIELIVYKCDYCGELHEKPYVNYLRGRKNIEKDSCNKKSCQKLKKEDISLMKYGVTHHCKLDEHKETISKKLLKYSYEDAYIEFLNRNLIPKFTKETYKNAKTKVEFLCLKHEDFGIQKISLFRLKRQINGCKHCAMEAARLDFDYVKSLFEQKNYILLDDIYLGNNIHMRYICPNHPEEIQKIKVNVLQQGSGCYYCGIEKVSGENNYRWNGGKSDLFNYLRATINEWKFKSMKITNFKCIITNEKFEIVHHLYNFSKIVREVLKHLNMPLYKEIVSYKKEELELIEIECLKLHYKYGLGVPLTKKVHKLFHHLYGYKNNAKQFEEFKIRYKLGEFKEVI